MSLERITFLKVQPRGGEKPRDACTMATECLGAAQATHEVIAGDSRWRDDTRRNVSEQRYGCLPCCQRMALEYLRRME